MLQTSRPKPKVFVDADVLFAGSAAPSEQGASLLVLRMAEITLLEAYSSQQVSGEVERNLLAKLPQALPAFRMIALRCLKVVSDPSVLDLIAYRGLADPADLPILAAAHLAGCSWLVSFNTRHYRPGHPEVSVLPPGDFLLRVRDLLARLG
ncbi:MAG: PIN domain-containing protein [Chloroflexota bacterium]